MSSNDANALRSLLRINAEWHAVTAMKPARGCYRRTEMIIKITWLHNARERDAPVETVKHQRDVSKNRRNSTLDNISAWWYPNTICTIANVILSAREKLIGRINVVYSLPPALTVASLCAAVLQLPQATTSIAGRDFYRFHPWSKSPAEN